MADDKKADDAAPEVQQDDGRPHSAGPDDKKQTNYAAVDREVARYMSDVRVDISPEDNGRLLRMIDRRVLSVMVATYFLQAIDKGTISFASIMGIIQDTNLQGPEYSWLTTCVYIAILFVEYPQNWVITRVPIAKYLSLSIFAWGAVLACHAACTSFAGLVAVRTLLGVFEAVCQPAFLVMSSMWYRREEQAARVTYWYMMNGAQQVVGGLLAYCFTLITTGPLRSWQWLFLAYGVVSAAFGAFVGWWLPDSPMRARCFSEADKRLMVERVRDNQTGMQNRRFKKEHVFEALRDPQVYAYALIALCTTLPTSGLGAYQGLVIVGFGFNRLEAQLLAMVLGFYILIVLLGSVWIVKRTNQSLLTMLGFVVPSFVGTILIMTLDLTDDLGRRVGLLICYYITLSFWSAQTLSLSMISRNVAGQTKKSVAITVNFLAWSAGNSIGPQVFLSWNKPKYFIAFATHLGCYSLLVIVIVSLRFYLTYQNSHRDKLAAQGVHEARDENMTRAFDDLTDKENLNFRYVY